MINMNSTSSAKDKCPIPVPGIRDAGLGSCKTVIPPSLHRFVCRKSL